MQDPSLDSTAVSRKSEEHACLSPCLEGDERYWPGGVTAHLMPSSLHVVKSLDRAVARVLRVLLPPIVPQAAIAATRSQPFEAPLLVSVVRCTLRYIVLPFVLPLLGIATDAAFGILLILDVIAAIAIVATLQRLWRLRHPRRWQYLLVAVIFVVLVGLFFVNDARMLFV